MHVEVSWSQNVSSVTRERGAPKSQWRSFGYHKALDNTWCPRSRANGTRSKQALQIKSFWGLWRKRDPLNKETMGLLWRPWVIGPLEQARAPDQGPVEPHGESRVSRSKDNGPLGLVAPKSRVNWAPSDTITPGPRWGPISTANWPLEQARFPKSRVIEVPLDDPRAT